MHPRPWLGLGIAMAAAILLPSPVYAMHISEGILPVPWAALWFAASMPFLLWGLRALRNRGGASAHLKPMVGLVGAAVFIISCMPVPVPTAVAPPTATLNCAAPAVSSVRF